MADVLAYRQGSSGIPDRLKDLSRKFEVEVNAKKYETAREILRSMKREYGAENSLVKKGRFTLRMAGMDLDDLH